MKTLKLKIWIIITLLGMILIILLAVITKEDPKKGPRVFAVEVMRDGQIITKIDCHTYSVTDRHYWLYTDTGEIIDDGEIEQGMDLVIKAKGVEDE